MSGSEVWDMGPVSEDALFEVVDVLYAKVGETHGHLMSHDKSDKRVTKQ